MATLIKRFSGVRTYKTIVAKYCEKSKCGKACETIEWRTASQNQRSKLLHLKKVHMASQHPIQ
jgi:hypothetical protein